MKVCNVSISKRHLIDRCFVCRLNAVASATIYGKNVNKKKYAHTHIHIVENWKCDWVLWDFVVWFLKSKNKLGSVLHTNKYHIQRKHTISTLQFEWLYFVMVENFGTIKWTKATIQHLELVKTSSIKTPIVCISEEKK